MLQPQNLTLQLAHASYVSYRSDSSRIRPNGTYVRTQDLPDAPSRLRPDGPHTVQLQALDCNRLCARVRDRDVSDRLAGLPELDELGAALTPERLDDGLHGGRRTRRDEATGGGTWWETRARRAGTESQEPVTLWPSDVSGRAKLSFPIRAIAGWIRPVCARGMPVPPCGDARSKKPELKIWPDGPLPPATRGFSAAASGSCALMPVEPLRARHPRRGPVLWRSAR